MMDTQLSSSVCKLPEKQDDGDVPAGDIMPQLSLRVDCPRFSASWELRSATVVSDITAVEASRNCSKASMRFLILSPAIDLVMGLARILSRDCQITRTFLEHSRYVR